MADVGMFVDGKTQLAQSEMRGYVALYEDTASENKSMVLDGLRVAAKNRAREGA